ncbi:MAG: hypothetical protein ACYS8Z_15770 [Planctomycetota bacterium]
MSKVIAHPVRVWAVLGLFLMLGAAASADWFETFDNMTFDQTWTWGCYPDVTKTFTHTLTDGPGDNDYLSMDESTKFDEDTASYGSAFGIGFCTHEKFTDVRVGTVVNVAGDAASFYHGMGARASYFVDNGSISGVPGIIANAYIMHINWEDWPPEFYIDIEKVIWNQNNMAQGFDVAVPGLDNGGSFYAALDIVGNNPTYVTGYLYEYEGGPLVAKTATLVDTDAQDSWEGSPIPEIPGNEEAVFPDGYSGIFGQNERSDPAGYHTTFDDVSSASGGARGPVAVCLSPVDGATGVDIDAADLEWVEAASTTSRELWFGKEGAMRLVSPAGTAYDPGTLELGQTYQWRVNQIGPAGTTEGPVFTFMTEGTSDGCLLIDDFESYGGDWDIQVAWPDDIDGWNYTFLETFEVYSGAKAMRFEYQNQFEPYITKLVHTFAGPQDLTKGDLAVLSLHFRGLADNYEQKLFVELEDSRGPAYAVAVDNPFSYAAKTEVWQKWIVELSEFSGGGLDLTAVTKISIGTGDGTPSAQPIGPPADMDFLYIDDIKICPPRCTLNSNADLDGDCKIGFGDFSAIANEWLNEGEYVLP